jgi:hypothetical protein
VSRFAGLRRRLAKADDALTDLQERVEHPILTSRRDALTLTGTATVAGVASLPGNESEVPGPDTIPEAVLFRLDVRRSDGATYECGVVQESASGVTRQVEPGLAVAVRCHPEDPEAAIDWEATAALVRRRLEWRDSVLRWTPADEWPARGAVEVRLRPADADRLAERRARWRRARATLADLAPGQKSFDQGRRQYTVSIDIEGRQLDLLEAVPDLAVARLVEVRVEPDRRVLANRVGAPLAALTEGAQACIDWEATLAQAEFRGLEGYDAG